MKEFMSTLYSFDNNGNKEDDESSIESSEDSQSNSEVVIQTWKKKKAPLISEPSEESQTDSEVVNPKRKKKPPLIKGCVCYIFASLFLSIKESFCEIKKNVFASLQKLFSFSRKIKV